MTLLYTMYMKHMKQKRHIRPVGYTAVDQISPRFEYRQPLDKNIFTPFVQLPAFILLATLTLYASASAETFIENNVKIQDNIQVTAAIGLMKTEIESDQYLLCDSARTCNPILIERYFTTTSIITSLPANTSLKNTKKDNFLDRQRVFVNGQFLGLKNGLDRILSQRKNTTIEDDRSFLVLNLESIFGESGEHEFNVRARAKADLPNTKQRFKFIFESQPEEDVSLENSERVGRLRNDKIVNDNAVAGIEFTQDSREFEWRPSTNFGSRLDFPLDVFTRFRLQKKKTLPSSWLLTSRFDFSYFVREGAIPAISLSLDRPINDVLSFLSISRYKYTRNESLQEYFQSVQLNHIYSDRLLLEYKLGAYGDSEPSNDLDGYFTHVAFKKRVYHDWIYFSVIPEVSFLKEDNWDPSFAITLQLQTIYSNQ